MDAMSQRKIACVMFDEFHSETWSASMERAKEIQPDYPVNSSYSKAAAVLEERDFVIKRNIDSLLHAGVLVEADVLVLLHPCDSKWEKTTSNNSPELSAREIIDILDFVKNGGGVVIVSEYEHDKYGNNLNEFWVFGNRRVSPQYLVVINGRIPHNRLSRARCDETGWVSYSSRNSDA